MSTYVDKFNFPQWLQSEMDKRAWSQGDIAKRSGLSKQAISNYLNEQRSPNQDALAAIARALGYTPEFVLRLVGILPPIAESELPFEKAKAQYDMLSEERKRRIVRQIQLELDMQAEEEEVRHKQSTPQSIPGAAKVIPD